MGGGEPALAEPGGEWLSRDREFASAARATLFHLDLPAVAGNTQDGHLK